MSLGGGMKTRGHQGELLVIDSLTLVCDGSVVYWRLPWEMGN